MSGERHEAKRAQKERLGIAFLLALAVAGVLLADPGGFITRFERITIDLRHKYFSQKTPNTDNIVVIDISEESIRILEPFYGRFPWPRSVHGELVDYLVADGAKVIGFDVFFSERTLRQEVDLHQIQDLKELAREAQRPDSRARLVELLEAMRPDKDDEDLIASVARSGRTFQASILHVTAEEKASEPARAADDTTAYAIRRALAGTSLKSRAPLPIPIFYNGTVPMQKLADASAGVGHINFIPDPDGPCRRTSLLMGLRSAERMFPSMALSMAAFALGVSRDSIEIEENEIRIGDVVVPTRNDGSMLIRYQGGTEIMDTMGKPHFNSFYEYIPYAEVLQSIDQINLGEQPTLKRGLFKDKIVLVGSTAAGLFDLRATPFEAVSPGVDIHANVIDNILSRRFLVEAPLAVRMLFVFLMAAAVAAASALTGPRTGFLASLLAVGAGSALSWYFFDQGVLLPMVGPGAAGIISYIAVILWRYATEEKEKRRTREAFGKYLSSAVLEEVMKNLDGLQLGGQRKHMTVLFSDIADFTGISETLPPEEISRQLSEYLTKMVECVLATGGILDKFIGDAVVAEWNAPGEQPDHAARACRCALMMTEELAALHEKWKKEGRPLLHMRIGINTGEMVVGNMGSQNLFDYTVIGNEVNTGARLEPLNKDFNTRIAVSGVTWAEAEKAQPGKFFGRELARVAVKGRKTALEAYELIGWADAATDTQRKAVILYREAMDLYLQSRFTEARKKFEAALAVDPTDGPSRSYVEICRHYEVEPPPADWGGVYVQKTK